jgi:peptide deformylase
MHGDHITIEGTELLARCLQHETDHLNGVLFIDRMTPEERKKAMKEIRESEWFGIAAEQGNKPKVKISPHKTMGLGL